MLPNRPIRVLVVDDAVVIRKIVTDVLKSDPEIEVVGTAADGHIALQKITQVNPDIITLDVEMPVMDGLETLRQLRRSHPKLPVIMFSTLTERGAQATIEALALGASDYVTKPANIGKVGEALQRTREQLIPRIKALCTGQVPIRVAPVAQPPAATRPQAVTTPQQTPHAVAPSSSVRRDVGIEVLAIGVSTGGPNALAAILPLLPATLPVPVVLVQHMPPMFTRLLAERLNQQSKLTVVEAAGDEELNAGTVYIAPGDYHLVVERRGAHVVTRLHQGPPENSCRPAVDVLFRSVADVFGAGAFGVVLTGMGQDGLRGSEDIRRAGGAVFAQDEATSVVWGMPGFVARAGLAERVVPLPEMATEIVRRVTARASSPRAAVAASGR
ncbi:MAG: chemotaxis response regulator protein-glutamate methylesterase [Acidobacteria bacterium]|nr:chemotaxis response regulator protein-glutamate methylesterase [Acidobacteriota bacterium]